MHSVMCRQVRAALSLASRTHATVQAKDADARMTADARPVLLLASVVVSSAGVWPQLGLSFICGHAFINGGGVGGVDL